MLAKRLFDFFGAALFIVVLSPLLVIIAILVRLVVGSPVLFVQRRPGLHGRPFRFLKFRTMTDRRDPDGRHAPDAERLIPFGRFLRSWSLDEVPQLLNVLAGDMSLVGPRPLLMEYMPLYSKEQARRHSVKPGLTGWAQINGRNTLTWDDRFAFDIWYVDNRTFWLDLRILLLTVGRVFQRQGVSADGHPTMPRFDQQQDRRR